MKEFKKSAVKLLNRHRGTLNIIAGKTSLHNGVYSPEVILKHLSPCFIGCGFGFWGLGFGFF